MFLSKKVLLLNKFSDLWLYFFGLLRYFDKNIFERIFNFNNNDDKN